MVRIWKFYNPEQDLHFSTWKVPSNKSQGRIKDNPRTSKTLSGKTTAIRQNF